MRCQDYQKMKHVYMLQVSADEVIDATRIGGYMRFVNHSCDPNCQMEKWNVLGRERCGLFAIRDVKCGDELTFDYQLQCVDFGNSIECLCGSRNCRGIIGMSIEKRSIKRQRCVESESKRRMVQFTIDDFFSKR
ncbi:hypothetical protein PInf_016477 [Phytophthora infestans]|nr:hypothetical protein PInf_016477 [Phytophthora infestans]